MLCSLALWKTSGGHLSFPETSNLVLGHLIYGLLVGAIALFAASISDSAATAAIVTLAFTLGSWVLDFTLAGQPGLLEWIARLSLTQVLRPFEQGLLSVAFSPDFGTNGKLYVYFTNKAGNEVVWELHARNGAASVRPGHRQLLEIPDSEPNHNGGQLQFGPDGMLYVNDADVCRDARLDR